MPMIEQCKEIVHKFNSVYGETLTDPEIVLPSNKSCLRLPGIDGKAKMSKSLGNCIYLSDEEDVVKKKVMSMFTDPNHLRVEDPGQVEGNPVFIYLDAFCKDEYFEEFWPEYKNLDELKAHYQRGGLGDVVSADSSVFDSESVDTLRAVSSQTPQAKVRGVVKKIEVFYNGDKEDMCDSLRKLTNKYDRVLSKEFEELGQKVFTGKVDEGFRIDGESLLLDTVAIRISITQKVPAGIGDKVVLANQMKSIISGILLNEVTTESGRKIDGLFSSRSCDARIVNSPFLMGAAASLLEFQGKIIANEFLS
jgi:hypothetical protein